MTTTPHETDDTATVDAPETAAGQARRDRFRAWRRSRPFWGGLVTIVAGLELFGSGQLDFGHLHLQFGVQGMQATILPIALVLLGILAWTMPVHRVFYGVIALVVSVYSLIGVNFGGFALGTILGVVGSVWTLAWLPRDAVEPAPEAATATARPRHADGLDLTGSAPTTDDTLVLDDSPAPRPFPGAPAEAGAVARSLPAVPRGGRARLNAVGAGVLVSALALGGTGAALPVAASASTADQSGWCVLDPLHVFCPADDDAGSGDPTGAPSESPTATGSPTETAGSPADDGASDASTPAPSGGATAGDGGGSAAGDTPSSSGGGTAGDGAHSGAPADDTAAADATGKDATDDTSDTSDGTTDQASVEKAAKEGVEALADQLKLCLGEGKDLGSSAEVTVPNLSSHLSGTKFQITNSWYKGNVTLKRVDGTTVRAMKFTADKAVVPGFRLDVPAKADGSQGLVATSDSITMKGDVLLYATKFSGKLLGIPLTFTPECAPPGFIPLPSMTDVKIEMVANTAQSLAYDNPHQEVYEH
ncbi:DUF6114 domain-containing protein [Luteimicrobium sp. DT211]|uniref:DUF6114 domain-containing protein n=1 Tax=Luteimicrobium sp. DT211 TaxID=3393412 RepID=UPI003CF631FF